MIKQNTDWGQILWLAENREILPLQGLQVGIVSLFPGRNQARHIHYDEQVIYVVRGQARSIINGEESVLSAGDFLHWKAGVEHQVYNNGFEIIQKMKDSKVIIITAYDSFEYAQKALRLGAVDIILKPIEFQQLRQAIARAVGWNFTGNEVADQTLAYHYEHYNDKIDLETLARQIFCSESHLARSFKKYTGMTVVSFVHKIRIEKSRHMLKEEGLSVKEAAERAGYQNLNHFYKYFKQYTGMTPAAYMKKNGSRTAIDLAEKGTENGEEKL